MRQLIDTHTKEVIDVTQLSPQFICRLGEMLNDPALLHVDTLYFTRNGSYYFNIFEYKGEDKEFKKLYKGKKYARFKRTNFIVKDKLGMDKNVKRSLPDDNYEIIAEYDSTFFVNEYIKSLKKIK